MYTKFICYSIATDIINANCIGCLSSIFFCLLQESKVREILEAGEDLDLWSQLGLLLDAEADFDNKSQSRYLMQIFTKPVFGPQDTFFLEVLERRGAQGFGAGNITALAQSIILYQKQLMQRKNQ